MGTESIQVSGVISATPDRLYNAWLDAVEHSAFTGSKASVEPGVGGKFTAWDGYIQGTTVDLEPGRRIVQHWRSNEFPADSHDSRLEVLLEPIPEGTRLTLFHTDIPEGLAALLEQGWRDHYLSPMARYFGEVTVTTVLPEEAEETAMPAAAPKKAPARKAAAKKVAKPKPKAKAKAKAKARPKAKAKAKKKAAPKKKVSKGKSKKGRGGKKRRR